MGSKLLDPNYKVDEDKNDNRKGRESIKLEENIDTHDNKHKKHCCKNK